LEKNWANPCDKDLSNLVNISTGVAATPEVCIDLLHAFQKGEEAYQQAFQENHLQVGKKNYDTTNQLKKWSS